MADCLSVRYPLVLGCPSCPPLASATVGMEEAVAKIWGVLHG